ncbi:hypothetical protein [Porphyromonas gingivalis]|uniref:hypothetical protein n=1 Tax=Porphyromonas gingivalis TaxID=837 RepID=UPI002013AD9F|nr:hypothetical protein [Porphyromonas gingivalis]
MNNVNDRAPTAPSPISGSKPFMWRTVGAKVIPFSESAKSIDSFFRADAQEKARRLILPPKKESRRARRNNSSINRAAIAFAVTKVRLFSLQTNLSKSFSTGSTKNSPRRKGPPPKKEDKRERIYNMFARVRTIKKTANEKK